MLRPGDAEDEGDAVAGQHRARGPHQHVLAEERDPDLEYGAGPEREQNLGDREVEAERDLPEHLKRHDHRRQVEARVRELRQQYGVGAAANYERAQCHTIVCWPAMNLQRALRILELVVSEASGPVSVFVADPHGEVVAAATMDGAAPDTRLNAQRKAYTAARSDATTTAALAEKVRDDPVERASFDPFFTFFRGGVAVFEGDERIGSVGVSGLPGEEDERLALLAIERSAS